MSYQPPSPAGRLVAKAGTSAEIHADPPGFWSPERGHQPKSTLTLWDSTKL